MKKLLVATLAFTPLYLAAPAAAFEGQVRQCFVQHWQEPVFRATQHLVRGSFQRIEYRGNNYAERVYYPAVYEERRTRVQEGRYVLRQVACN